MKAISLWQPWAMLYALGMKENETRGWSTSHRGPLLIHAAKRMELDAPACWAALADRGFTPANIPRGALVGAVLLEGCALCNGVQPSRPECLYGDFSRGRYAWRSRSAVVFAKPVPWRGMQQLFEVDLRYSPEPPERPTHEKLVAALDAGGGVLAW